MLAVHELVSDEIGTNLFSKVLLSAVVHCFTMRAVTNTPDEASGLNVGFSLKIDASASVIEP